MSKTGRMSYRRKNRRSPKRKDYYFDDRNWAPKFDRQTVEKGLWHSEFELMPEGYGFSSPRPDRSGRETRI